MDGQLDRQMSEFLEACRRSELKITHQRMEIFRELAATTEHPDAETVYRRVKRRIPAISRDTVYRNLRDLEAHGIVRNITTTGSRGRFDADLRRHYHFICTECGRIEDFDSEHLDAFVPPAAVADLGEVKAHRFELRGTCRACKAV